MASSALLNCAEAGALARKAAAAAAASDQCFIVVLSGIRVGRRGDAVGCAECTESAPPRMHGVGYRAAVVDLAPGNVLTPAISVRIWDLPTRVFHAALAVLVSMA